MEVTNFVSASEWKEKGELIPVFDKEIFTIDIGEHEECIVILHGYLTSSYDYHRILDELSKHYRVVLHDLVGFGFSTKLSDNHFTIIEQADYLVELWKTLGLNHFILFGHDLGTAISQEILARKNAHLLGIQITQFIYCNGNLPINHSYFLDTQKFLKKEVSKNITAMLASFGYFSKLIKSVFYDDGKVSDEELKQMWFLLEDNNGRSLLKFIYHYLREREIFWDRWKTALLETNIPIKIIWGKKDPLLKDKYPESLSKKVDSDHVYWIEKSGHFPMLENPKEFIDAVLAT